MHDSESSCRHDNSIMEASRNPLPQELLGVTDRQEQLASFNKSSDVTMTALGNSDPELLRLLHAA